MSDFKLQSGQNAIHGGALIITSDDLTVKKRIDLKELSVEKEIEVASVKIDEYNMIIVLV